MENPKFNSGDEEMIIKEKNLKDTLEISYLAGIIASCTEKTIKTKEQPKAKQQKPTGTTTQEITKDERTFLSYVASHPNTPTTKIYKELGWSARKGNETKNKLEKKGLIKVTTIKNKEGWKKTIQIT